MLFIEAPAGVGFSYADFPSGLVHNDTSTAQDNLNALIYFFANFPEYAQNELYISGESSIAHTYSHARPVIRPPTPQCDSCSTLVAALCPRNIGLLFASFPHRLPSAGESYAGE